MVRIINNDKPMLQKQEQLVLTEKSKALLQMIGIIIADTPTLIKELLLDYSIELSEAPTDKELTDHLLSAIGECNEEFNKDFARIILDCTLESTYDDFDAESLFDKESSDSTNTGGGGLWSGIANAVGSIGSVVGQGIKGRQAKDQASTATLQGIYAYKTQLAANQQPNKKSNTKNVLLISLLVIVGAAILAYMSYVKKQVPIQIPIKT